MGDDRSDTTRPPALGAKPGGSPRPNGTTAKRALDLIVAILGLILLGLPMMWVAWLIRLDSGGPSIYRQDRVGRHGRIFRIHKFRTMFVGAQAGSEARQLTISRDPRVTRIGHFLRRHRIDEWPQLIDVLKGDMSLVGPRPEVPKYVALYPEDLKRIVLSVRPGITDPAALAFRHEAEWMGDGADAERIYAEQIMPMKLKMQAEYAQAATMVTDFRVMLRTLVVLFRPHAD